MVEKMSLVTVIGDNNKLDNTLKTIIDQGIVNPISSDIGLKVLREDYQDNMQVPLELVSYDLEKLKAGPALDEVNDKLIRLFDRLDMTPQIDKRMVDLTMSRADLIDNINQIYHKISDIDSQLDELAEKRAKLIEFSSLNRLEHVDFDLAKLKELAHFDIRLGTMPYEYEKRLDLNYDNIKAIIIKVGALRDNTVYLVIAPLNIKVQTDNLLRSVHFEEMPILWEYMNYPDQMSAQLREDVAALDRAAARHQAEIDKIKTDIADDIIKAYSHVNLEKAVDEIRPLISQNESHYVLAFWVPKDQSAPLKAVLETCDRSLKYIEHADDVVNDLVVPTKLLNRWLFKPFESLVNMYGTPNYREVDPTGFLAITYMFLFGAMFGDLGQGFVFWVAGVILATRPAMLSVGGVLKRIGLSSMFFGFIYDSIFGVEHVISHFLTSTLGFSGLQVIFLRPLENTNVMLLLAVAIGVCLLIISYLISIYNKLRQGDIQEGVFGRNGLNGLVLFISLLIVAALIFYGAAMWLIRLVVAVLGISVILLIVREPLSRKLAGKLPLYHDGAASYYMESGFELIETFLGMISNGISFIRVGAFALNHVGLFIAFHTIADMIGTPLGNVAMFIIGNLVVIALEGLIVFIQGLRLIYYELFSKFYSGDGQPFVGITINQSTEVR